jgi:hypothetical protein
MRSVRLGLAVGSIALATFFAGAVVAAAAEPTPPAGSEPASIPENAAEMAEIAAGQLVLEPVPVAEAVPARALTPEMIEINAALAAERTRVDELTTRLKATTDEAAALTLVQEIETAKQGTELAILAIQARHARAAGREAQAQEIESAISRMSAVMNAPAMLAVPRAVAPDSRPTDGGR